MGTKTGSSAGSKLAMFVALVVVAGFGYGLVKREPSDERSGVLFTVAFEPAQRVTFIEIVVFVDVVAVETDRTKKTPWDTVVQLRRGETATIKATQSVPSKLSCAVNGEVQETREFPGSVTCTHKRA